jgi:hypothetical protein
MKATQSRAVAMSDVFRAVAGSAEAQFDLIACTVYSAAYSIMQAGNKTQFNKLAADAAMYGVATTESRKLVRGVLGIKTMNSAAKHFEKVYFAIHATLAAFPAPELIKDLPRSKDAQFAILDPLASGYADQFTANFTTIMLTPARTADEQAEADAARIAKKAEKEAEAARAAKVAEREARKSLDATIAARVEQAVDKATAPDTMARTVADMLVAGSLSAELEAMLIEAARTRETAVLLARVASTAPETETEAA